MAPGERDDAAAEIEHLRHTRKSRVDRMLDRDMLRQAPGNAAYWVAVIALSFAINLLVLMAIAR